MLLCLSWKSRTQLEVAFCAAYTRVSVMRRSGGLLLWPAVALLLRVPSAAAFAPVPAAITAAGTAAAPSTNKIVRKLPLIYATDDEADDSVRQVMTPAEVAERRRNKLQKLQVCTAASPLCV